MLVTAGDNRSRGTVMVDKPDRFGLKHQGAKEDFEKYRCDIGMVHDIYFPEANPKDMFAVCGAEEIRDMEEDPAWCRRPLCTHEFYAASLKAHVTLFYRRTHLKDWKQLQERATRLLETIERQP